VRFQASALADCAARLRPFDGVLALAAPSPRVRGVFDTTRLTKAISIYESTAEAVQACRPAG